MKIKFFEVRDRCTCISTMAIKTVSTNDFESAFLRRDGYGENNVLLINLPSQEMRTDPFKWGDTRTMLNAHQYIERNFDDLPDGSVIDVEYILGESDTPKTAEIWKVCI